MAEKEAEKPELAPQPGEVAKQADAGDAALIFFVGLGHFFRNIFRISLLAYFFWTGLMYMVGATLLLVGFQNLSPTIGGVPACPAKQNGYLFVALQYLLGAINLGTSYGYSAIQTMSLQDFEHLTGYMQTIGFMTKVIPTYSRTIHVFNFCQLDVMAIQLMFLPECNSYSFFVVFGFVLLLWWMNVIFGIWAKQKIFVPPYLYEPMRPGSSFIREIDKMMRAFGP